MSTRTVESPVRSVPRRRWKLAGLVVLLVGLWLLSQQVDLSVERLKTVMNGAGALGVLGFLAVFVVAQIAQLPGLPFVLAARLAYGLGVGFAASYVAALLAVSAVFGVVRALGRGALDGVRFKWVQRALAQIESKPIRTVALLRALFAVSPPLNYALALSPLRFRDHLLGSALGLLIPISIWVSLSDVFVRWLS